MTRQGQRLRRCIACRSISDGEKRFSVWLIEISQGRPFYIVMDDLPSVTFLMPEEGSNPVYAPERGWLLFRRALWGRRLERDRSHTSNRADK